MLHIYFFYLFFLVETVLRLIDAILCLWNRGSVTGGLGRFQGPDEAEGARNVISTKVDTSMFLDLWSKNYSILK